MDTKRAQEIVVSPVMAEVSYLGKPIYIQSVNETAQTAKIHPIDRTNKIQIVPITDLIEH